MDIDKLNKLYTTWYCDGTMRITDPSYGKGIENELFKIDEKISVVLGKGMENGLFKIAGKISVVPGDWDVYYTMVEKGMSKDRVYWVWTTHKNRPPKDIKNFKEITDFCVGVNTGRMGFFNDADYPDDNLLDHLASEDSMAFKGHSLVATIKWDGEDKCMGVHSSSGWGGGAGSYTCYARRNKDDIIDGLYVQFITPEIEKKIRTVCERDGIKFKYLDGNYEIEEVPDIDDSISDDSIKDSIEVPDIDDSISDDSIKDSIDDSSDSE
uniref:Uncharacterized protein n=1 Tax=Mimivirus LCMiAC01 TaxID=2506608 RepID=A0A481YYS7_9VIRU|nr:MAG: hypothetical protein LCMiAC01_00020 [Mimivirus LCMiAC01]